MAPIKTIDKQGTDKASQKGGKSVRRHQKTKLLRTDIVNFHELLTQRHHDHEIHDVGKLDNGKDENKESFVSDHSQRFIQGKGRQHV